MENEEDNKLRIQYNRNTLIEKLIVMLFFFIFFFLFVFWDNMKMYHMYIFEIKCRVDTHTVFYENRSGCYINKWEVTYFLDDSLFIRKSYIVDERCMNLQDVYSEKHNPYLPSKEYTCYYDLFDPGFVNWKTSDPNYIGSVVVVIYFSFMITIILCFIRKYTNKQKLLLKKTSSDKTSIEV